MPPSSLHTICKSRSFRVVGARTKSIQLPDEIQDAYREEFGVPPPAEYLTHLKRELMHAVWDLLLTVEFIHAYLHGVVIKCYDGVTRRIFPRFFTYSADYPEK